MTDIEKDYWRTADYAIEVSVLIRDKYSQDAELAILRQKDTKPEEFEEYNSYCEECKNTIKAKIAEAQS